MIHVRSVKKVCISDTCFCETEIFIKTFGAIVLFDVKVKSV